MPIVFALLTIYYALAAGRMALIIRWKEEATLALDNRDALRARLVSERALRLAPSDAELHRQLGDAMLLEGVLVGATEQYVTALHCGAGDWSSVYWRLGKAWHLRGNRRLAVANWRKAVALGSDPVSVRASQAELRADASRPLRAR